MRALLVSANTERVNSRFARSGIRRFGFLLLGAPGRDPETIRESFDFADRLSLDMFKVTVGVRIYPGSPLEEIARREGVVAADDDLLQPLFYAAPGHLKGRSTRALRPGVEPLTGTVRQPATDALGVSCGTPRMR